MMDFFIRTCYIQNCIHIGVAKCLGAVFYEPFCYFDPLQKVQHFLHRKDLKRKGNTHEKADLSADESDDAVVSMSRRGNC